MPASHNADVALRTVRAVEVRDASALNAIYDPDIEFHWPPGLPFSGTWRGDDLVVMAERYLAALDPLQPDEYTRRMDAEVVGEGDDGRVVVRYSLRARTPNGRRFETATLAEYRIGDGRLKRAEMFYFDLPGLTAFLAQASADPEGVAHADMDDASLRGGR